MMALMASVVSGRNSYEWFASLRPPLVAALMAVTMVGASILLPDFAIALMRSGRRVVGSLLLLSGLIAVAFCMVTTVAALYNTRTARTAGAYQAAASSLAGKDKTRRLDDALQGLLSDLAYANSLVSSTQAKVDEIPAGEALSDTSQALVGRLNRYLADRRRIQGRIDDVRGKILSTGQAIAASGGRKDFYSFIAALLHGEPEAVEFWTGALPAVFLDLVGPVMAGVALFL